MTLYNAICTEIVIYIIKLNLCACVCLSVCMYIYRMKNYLTDLYEIWNIDCKHKREYNELMFDIFLRGAKGAKSPLKINVPMYSKTTGQIFMKYKT